jgi:hypothetical protein
LALSLVLSAVVLAGCVMPYAVGNSRATILAPVMDLKAPLALGDTSAGSSKVGTAEAQGVILFAFGDCSIEAAMKNGGIKRIHHVDTEELSVLGIYVKQTVRVYGE